MPARGGCEEMSTGDLKPDLSVVIVSWNVKEQLGACLRSLYEHTQQVSFEVFVVDNASQDGSPEMVEVDFPQVKLIRNPVNMGFARANNQAIRLSTSRYVLLLNPDTLVLDDALPRMVWFLDQHPRAGIVGGKVLTPVGQIDFRCARRFPRLLTEWLELTRLASHYPHHPFFGQYLMGDWDHEGTRPVDTVGGYFLMARRAAIQEVGWLDEGFFMYGEDVDWCYRMHQAGWEVWYHGYATIYHVGGQSSRHVRDAMGIERFHSRYRYFRKHHGGLYAWSYRVLLSLISLGKVALSSVQAILNADVEKRRRFWGKAGLHKDLLHWALTGQNPLRGS